MADSRYNSDAPQDGHETGDLLDRDGFADAICDLVTTVPAPFTVGVYGSWGQGKTSFMKRVAVMLGDEKHQYADGEVLGLLSDKETKHTAKKGNPKYVSVWFDLWAHQSDDNPVVSMLQEALWYTLDAKEGRKPGPQALPQGIRSRGETLLAKAQRLLEPEDFQKVIEAFTHLSMVLASFPAAKSLATAAGSLITLDALEKALKIDDLYQKRRGSAAQSRKKSPTKAFEIEQAQTQLQSAFYRTLDMLSFDCERIVFFIDDLDRCLPEITVDLLEKIKIFLDHPKTVFVLGLDDEATRKAVAKVKSFDEYDPIRLAERESQATSRTDDSSAPDRASNQAKGTMARDYLEKIIQFPFRVPPASSDSHEFFVRDAVASNLSGLGEEKKSRVTRILADAASEKNASLRQIKRLVNAFTLNDRMGQSRRKTRDENGPTGNEEPRILTTLYRPEVMAVVTAVQILWDREYADLCRGENVNTRGEWLKGLFVASDEGGPQLGDLATSLLRKDAIALGEHKTPNSALHIQGFDPKEHPYAAYVESAAGSAPVEAPDPEEESGLKFRWLKPGKDYLEALKKASQGGRTWTETAAYIRDNPGNTIAIADDIWRILKVAGNHALLLSDQILALSAFHSEYVAVNWDTCDLNLRLQAEMRGRWGRQLCTHVVSASPNRSMISGESAGGFFLLSVEEVKEYEQGVCTRIDSGKPEWWWLRSVGRPRANAPVVVNDGTLHRRDGIVHYANGGVRPALWMNLES